MKISYVTNATSLINEKRLLEINLLLGQLSPKARTVTRELIMNVMQRGYFICAIDEKTHKIVGIATLTQSWKPTAFFGTIEDVVVDEHHRKHGIGTAMLERILKLASFLSMDYIELTSHPNR